MYPKSFIPIFILLALSIISCKKERPAIASQIIGQWELRAVYNGWIGNKNYPAGNGNYLKFTSSSFEIDTNKVLVSSGTYSLVKDKFNLTGENGYRIIYNHEANSSRIFVNVLHDSLTLSVDANDGGGSIYIRME